MSWKRSAETVCAVQCTVFLLERKSREANTSLGEPAPRHSSKRLAEGFVEEMVEQEPVVRSLKCWRTTTTALGHRLKAGVALEGAIRGARRCACTNAMTAAACSARLSGVGSRFPFQEMSAISGRNPASHRGLSRTGVAPGSRIDAMTPCAPRDRACVASAADITIISGTRRGRRPVQHGPLPTSSAPTNGRWLMRRKAIALLVSRS